MSTRAAKVTDSGLAARCAAIASFGAGLIHLVAAPGHWRSWMVAAVFLAAVAVFQLVWAVRTWKRPHGWLLAVGIAVNAAAAVLWVASRTAGVPFGPHAGRPEQVDAAGICVLLLECYVVMGAAWAWLQRAQPEKVSGFGGALVLVGANSVMMLAVLLGVTSVLHGPDHHQPSVAEAGTGPQPAVPALPVTDMGLKQPDGGHDHGS